ncbi:MAG TPA: flagellar export chaperone FliS [Virgibacillus sp.]|nr:flagellar export chaperone FliS [Virgibacillus sp.]
MSMNKQYQAYQDNAVNTATGGELTLMLYNGCLKFIKRAQKDMKENNHEGKNTHIQKAQDIIQELMLTLDQTVDLAKQLLPLYEYIHHLLTEANINNEVKLLEQALSFVTELRDTWKEVILKTRQKQFAQGSQV